MVVNAVSKSGTNQLTGRAFYYKQDGKWNATNYFLDLRGEENPDSGSDVWGFNGGGPIVRNKAFWFFNLERNLIDQAVSLVFPEEAAPLNIPQVAVMPPKSRSGTPSRRSTIRSRGITG